MKIPNVTLPLPLAVATALLCAPSCQSAAAERQVARATKLTCDPRFCTGTQFPVKYRGDAFIAFHGSWNRAPLPHGRYNVVFVPMKDGEVTGDWEVFADGFKGKDPLERPDDARYRPTGLAQGPDGSLYIADSEKGRIWRVVYRGGGGAS